MTHLYREPVSKSDERTMPCLQDGLRAERGS